MDEYCFICGQKIPKGMLAAMVKPYEFKEGKACMKCGEELVAERRRNKNVKN